MSLSILLLFLLTIAINPEHPSEEKKDSTGVRFAPIPHHNQFPAIYPFASLNQYSFPIEGGERTSLRVTQNYTALHFYKNSSDFRMGHDLESMQYRVDVAHSLGGRFRGMYSQSATMMWDGFMDPFLNWYHDALKLPNYGRELRPENDFEFYIDDENGENLVSPRNKVWYLNDPVLGLFYILNRNDSHVALSFHVKLPVGISRRGAGSGGMAGGVKAEYARTFRAFDVFQSGMIVVPGKSNNVFWNEATWHVLMMSGASYRWGEGREALVQFHYGNSPFRKIENHRISHYPVEVVLGYRLSRAYGIWTFGFSEDLQIPSPDFTVSISFQPKW